MNLLNHRLSLWLSGISVPLWWRFSRQSSPQRHEDPQRHRGPRQRKEVILILALAAAMLSFGSIVSVAREAQPNEDPQIEQRMKNLTQQLRCPVCQNETLADSNAELAKQMRDQIRAQMKAGKTDDEIKAYLTQRYGDFPLYKPPIKPMTYLLWFGPFVLLIGGTAVLFRFLKRRREMIHEQPLTADEQKRAEEILRSA
jgi:cytochrome c-type biogenesis protein CcmH